MKKRYVLIAILLVFSIFTLVSSTDSLNLTEEECLDAGGTWEEKIGCDTEEGEVCPQFYCKCNQGFSWSNETKQCIKISDKVLCESSDGEWVDNKCICPEDSLGFKENFGCDYALSIKEKNYIKGNKTSIIFLIGGPLLLILLIILIIFKIRKK